jgi:hypothetical protein
VRNEANGDHRPHVGVKQNIPDQLYTPRVKNELIQNGSKHANGVGQQYVGNGVRVNSENHSAAHHGAKTEQEEERVGRENGAAAVIENGAVDTTAVMENGGKEVGGVEPAIRGHNASLENYRQEGDTHYTPL